MTHWVYIVAVASGPAAFAVWRLARTFLLIVGGLTTNSQRSRQIERMLILSRGDAKGILETQSDTHDRDKSPPAKADLAVSGSSSTAAARPP